MTWILVSFIKWNLVMETTLARRQTHKVLKLNIPDNKLVITDYLFIWYSTQINSHEDYTLSYEFLSIILISGI